jgi:hypothetical protein
MTEINFIKRGSNFNGQSEPPTYSMCRLPRPSSWARMNVRNRLRFQSLRKSVRFSPSRLIQTNVDVPSGQHAVQESVRRVADHINRRHASSRFVIDKL